MNKRKGTSLVLRLMIVAAVLASFIVPIQPAFASTVNEAISPTPPSALLNLGTDAESIWWKITFESTPLLVRHIIKDPDGIVVETHDYDNASLGPNGIEDFHVVPLGGAEQYPQIYNNEQYDPGWTIPEGGRSGQDTYQHTFDVPAGAKPGNWTSRIEYYSTSIGMTAPEKASDETFWVRQPLTIFKYNDLDGDGMFDAGEPGLDGWEFHITGPGGYNVTTTTQGGGYIDLAGADSDPLPCIQAAGNYVITETLQTNWINTDPGEPGDPLLNQKTITIPGEIENPEDPLVRLGNMELNPDTSVTINASPSSLPDGGGTVDITVTEYNFIGSIDLTNVHVQITGAEVPIDDRTYANRTGYIGDSDSILEPGETWSWTIYDVPVTIDPTTFQADGHGYYGDPAVDVSWETGHYGERSSVAVDIRPPTIVPGTSNLGIGILIGIIGLAMGFVLYRRTRRA